MPTPTSNCCRWCLFNDNLENDPLVSVVQCMCEGTRLGSSHVSCLGILHKQLNLSNSKCCACCRPHNTYANLKIRSPSHHSSTIQPPCSTTSPTPDDIANVHLKAVNIRSQSTKIMDRTSADTYDPSMYNSPINDMLDTFNTVLLRKERNVRQVNCSYCNR